MLLNSLNRDMFKPFRSHNGLLGRVFDFVLEDLHKFYRGFLQRDASLRALWSDRPNCSHNVSQKLNISGAFLILSSKVAEMLRLLGK